MTAALDAWTLPLRGTKLLEASAGTGKTYTLEILYLRMLVESELAPSDILVVTYTNAAASELRSRIRARIREAIAAADDPRVDGHEPELARLAGTARASGILRRALREFDEAAIFTIHGFCQRTLKEYAFESGIAFDAELVEQSQQLQRTLAHDLWSRLLEEEDPAFVEWLLRKRGRHGAFEPETLRRTILEPLGADDEMPVLPETATIDAGDLARLGAAVERTWLEWAAAWREQGDDAAALLLGENGLKKNSYNPDTIATKWLPLLGAWADAITRVGSAAPMNAVDLPDWFAKLTPSELESKRKKNGRPVEHPFFDLCGRLKERIDALATARCERALALRVRFVELARREARRRREEQHRLFFDDLLTELRAALRPPGGDRLAELLRRRYRFALIDEFQDTDPVQYEIFRRVWHAGDATATSGGLFLIGDPKQAIYTFRGADVFTYLAARDDAAGAVSRLDVNRRSTAGLVAAVNALFGRPRQPFGLDAIVFEPAHAAPDAAADFPVPGRSGAGLRVLMADRAELLEAARGEGLAPDEAAVGKPLALRHGRTDAMRAMARDVADLLDAGPEIEGRRLVPKDVAVLCRRNAELARARRELEALGIPCVDRGEADVFETREAWELACVLHAMLRPGDAATLRAALATGAHGVDAVGIGGLDEDAPDLVAAGERFAEYGRIWSRRGVGRALATWRRRESVESRLLGYADGDRRATNWWHLAELLQRVEQDRSASRRGLVAWLENAIATPEARIEVGSEASLLRLERDDEAVSLVTLHRSKGLQYEVVYLPCLWESLPRSGGEARKPDGARLPVPVRTFDPESGRRIFDLGGDDYDAHAQRASEEERSEEFRLLYVGLTRARRQCVVVWGAFGEHFHRTPLAWLLAAPGCEAQGEDPASAQTSWKRWSDARWRAAWSEVAEAAGEAAVSVESARFDPRPAWRAQRPAEASLAFAPPRLAPRPPIVTTSFSALVRDAAQGARMPSGPFVTGRDVDTAVEEASSGPLEEAVPDLAGSMHEFPRGAEAGTLLHSILEEADLAMPDRDALRRAAEAALDRAGFDRSHVDRVVHVVESVARTPLPGTRDARCLGDIPADQRRPEIGFTLAALPGGGRAGLSPAGLADLLATAPEKSPLHAYAERAALLDWRTLQGFLRGFIDAVFCDGERYFLIDYKSNHLGVRRQDYMPDALVRPMIEHDYVLQYLVYAVALDRHLSTRIEGYDYERHFGGVYYLFLRGLARAHPPGCGIFFDRPPADLIQRISGLIGEPDAAGGGA